MLLGLGLIVRSGSPLFDAKFKGKVIGSCWGPDGPLSPAPSAIHLMLFHAQLSI